jgi:hypothetical protein
VSAQEPYVRAIARERNTWNLRSSFRKRRQFRTAPPNKKPTLRWVPDKLPPRSSAVGVISLSAGTGDSMPRAFNTNFQLCPSSKTEKSRADLREDLRARLNGGSLRLDPVSLIEAPVSRRNNDVSGRLDAVRE